MNPRRLPATPLMAGGLAIVAQAQIAQMDVKTAFDGPNRIGGSCSLPPGGTVPFRYEVSFNAGGTAAPARFASLTLQPAVIARSGVDGLNAFAIIGDNTKGNAVTDATSSTARREGLA